MQTLLLLGLQAESTVVPPPLEIPAILQSTPQSTPRCPRTSDADDVVVCGRVDPERYRLCPPTPPPGVHEGPPLAETSVGGGKLGVTTRQVMIGNVPSNRVMVSLKLPF